MCPDCSAAQNVAGPADLKIPQKAILNLVPFALTSSIAFNRLTALGVTGRSRFEQQISIGPMLVPADPAPEPTQVGQPVLVGLVDEDRVDVSKPDFNPGTLVNARSRNTSRANLWER